MRWLDILIVPPPSPALPLPSPFPTPFSPVPFSGKKGCRHTGSQRNTASVYQHRSVASVAAELGECAVTPHTSTHQLPRQVLGSPLPYRRPSSNITPAPHSFRSAAICRPFCCAAGVLWDRAPLTCCLRVPRHPCGFKSHALGGWIIGSAGQEEVLLLQRARVRLPAPTSSSSQGI